MTDNDLSRAALIMFAARQAGKAGSLEQMKAICFCIRNRVRAGWHDGHWIRCMEGHEAVAANVAPTEVFSFDAQLPAVRRLMRDVDEIFYGDRDRDSNGDLESAIGTQKYWYFLNQTVTPWFRENIIGDKENHPSHAQMGIMMFFE